MDKIFIRKCLEGHATPEEEDRFQSWLSDGSSDLSPLQEIMTGSWDGLPPAPAGEVMKEELLSALRKGLYPEQARVVRLHPLRPSRWWYGAAASLLLIGIALFQFTRKDSGSRTIPDTVVAANWKTLVNKDAKVRYAVLPDGSKVWLHPQSSLSYDISQTSDRRSVRLEGEAFFDVAHDERRPFSVYAGDMATKVLGTSFNVEAYAKEDDIRVSLVEGKVAVGRAVPQQVLQAGEMMDYNKVLHTGSRSMLKMTNRDEWTKGYLILNDLPVAYALERLAGGYNLKVRYDKGVNLSDRRITTVFKKETLHQMLDILLFVSRYRYTIAGDTLQVIQNSN